MAEQNGRGTTDSVAQRVLGICRRTDEGARITYVGRDESDRTVVRIASSVASSVSALQRGLASAMPLARVRTSENTLDGSMHAQITVPTCDDEWDQALGATVSRRPLKALRALAVAMLFIGIGMWWSGLMEGAGSEDPKEI